MNKIEEALNTLKTFLGLAEVVVEEKKKGRIKYLACGSFDIIKTEKSTGRLMFKGLASTNTKDRGWDVVHQNGIKVKIPNGKIPILHNHNPGETIGHADSYKVVNDGTAFEISGYLEAPFTDERRQLLAGIKSGSISGLSIGFIEEEGEWNDKAQLYDIKSIDLAEVSITPTPMNPEAVLTEIKDEELTDEEKSMSLKEENPFNSKNKEESSKDDKPSNSEAGKEENAGAENGKTTEGEESTDTSADVPSLEELTAENAKLKEQNEALKQEVSEYEETVDEASEYIDTLETIKGVSNE